MKASGSSFVSVLGIAAIVSFAPLAGRAATEDHLEKTFSVGSGGKVVVDANVGSIELTASDRNDVHVEVLRKAEARGLFGGGKEREEAELKANQITFSQDGQTVTVRGQRDKEADNSMRNRVNMQVRYVIAVPKQFAADLKTSGGSIRAAALKGDLKAKTSGGSLKFTDITGPIDGRTSGGGIEVASSDGQASVKTSGGSIRIQNHKGDVTARTSGGSITVDHIEGNLQANTSGGSVHADLAKPPTGDVRLETSGGGITVGLPEATAAEIDAKTSGGSVQSDLTLTTVEHKSRSALKGKLNAGGRTVYLRTSGGSIHVKKA
jgi:hypothetical protein